MKIGIIGSSTSFSYPDFKINLKQALKELLNKYSGDSSLELCTASSGRFSELVSLIFYLHGFPSMKIEANYTKYGKAATYMRTKEIVNASDKVYIFIPNGKHTPGTKTAYKYARKLKKDVVVWSVPT